MTASIDGEGSHSPYEEDFVQRQRTSFKLLAISSTVWQESTKRNSLIDGLDRLIAVN